MGLFNRRAAIGAIAIIATLALAACNTKSSGGAVDGDMSLGDPNAKVKVVEYGSLSCVHCANWNRDVFPDFKKKYIDTGKVYYTFRPFQLGPQDTYTSAGDLLGRCMGKDKYLTVMDALFHSQVEALQGSTREVIMRVGRSGGMSEEQVTACLTDEKAIVAQADRMTSGRAKEVKATPTFFIGDNKTVESEMPLAEFDKIYAEQAK
ncbi:MAG: thioredoxin domain-containing protein [Caulobacter sp.]|nr:thioredoxin domain-containing protein [Caulobacter sp.]